MNKCTKVLLFLALGVMFQPHVSAQCTNTSAFGTVTAPITGDATTISTCSFQSEYSTINGVVGGATFTVSASIPGTFITVRQGTPGGAAVASGVTPLTFLAPESGTYYAHWNVNASCATATSCMTTSIRNEFALNITKTVGTEPGVCASTSEIVVPPGTTVYYCYAATNSLDETFSTHTLVDDQLGTIFTGFSYSLTPGSSVDTVAAGLSIPAQINETTTNTAVWTASGPGIDSAVGIASATVTVDAAQFLDVTGIANPSSGGSVSCVPAMVVSGGGATCSAAANAGFVFTGWSGDCSGSAAECALSDIVAPVSAIANFAPVSSDARAIPTIGAWGLMLLSAMIALVACLRNRLHHSRVK